MSDRLLALGIAQARSDADRAVILAAIREFAASIGSADLAAEAQAMMPAAHPFNPPEPWQDSYGEGFKSKADEGRGTYVDEWDRYCAEYWRGSLSDSDRQARLESPSIGFEDGCKDAENLNSVDTTTSADGSTS